MKGGISKVCVCVFFFFYIEYPTQDSLYYIKVKEVPRLPHCTARAWLGPSANLKAEKETM